jgi:hypothetical protein
MEHNRFRRERPVLRPFLREPLARGPLDDALGGQYLTC